VASDAAIHPTPGLEARVQVDVLTVGGAGSETRAGPWVGRVRLGPGLWQGGAEGKERDQHKAGQRVVSGFVLVPGVARTPAHPKPQYYPLTHPVLFTLLPSAPACHNPGPTRALPSHGPLRITHRTPTLPWTTRFRAHSARRKVKVSVTNH
jgi:hypothetical protein